MQLRLVLPVIEAYLQAELTCMVVYGAESLQQEITR